MLLYLLTLTFIFITIGTLLLIKNNRNYWTQKGLIPHIKSISLFGNVFPVFVSRSMSMIEFITQVYKKFPDAKYTGILQFQTPVIVLRDPDLIRDICIRNFDHFEDHESFVSNDVDPLLAKNLFFLRGKRWREMRHFLSPSFTRNKMNFLFELVSKCSENFIKYFLDNLEEINSVEMKDIFTRYTNDVIATAAFGITVNSLKDRNNEFYLKGKQVTDFSSIRRGLKIFALRFFKPIMKLLNESLLPRSCINFFQKIIQETVKIRDEKNIIRPDMIHLLMEASRNEKGVEVTTDDIVAQSLIFFAAGFSTIATVMSFAVHELAVNSEIQEKLRQEVDYFTKQEGKISYDTLSKMKYMDMVISETLRKYPANAIMNRMCVKKYTLPKSTPDSNEYTIEPNSLIWLPIYALHHDENNFPNPEKFDPERFNDDNKKNINPHSYIPFGVGPRKCIGNRFALMEIKILIVYLLQNFVIEREERTKHPIIFEKSFLVVADGELWVKFRKRNQDIIE
ncbi:cytochrome P450 9e2-like [Leptopilina boulardi]|uniref:cytochrome P450 9e2-like n=1 Tax=Leptopilina boulardi TaxID=63433 RepID=UPI0021F621CE|nr:cytochrome P450 9e2-like [Leptopilina boulardi]